MLTVVGRRNQFRKAGISNKIALTKTNKWMIKIYLFTRMADKRVQ